MKSCVLGISRRVRFSAGEPTNIMSLFLTSSSDSKLPRFTRICRCSSPKVRSRAWIASDLADAGVMIQNFVARIAGGIEVTHPGFRPAHEGPVAENDPGLLRSVGKGFPESRECDGNWFFWVVGTWVSRKKPRDRSYRYDQQNQQNYKRRPSISRLFCARREVVRLDGLGDRCGRPVLDSRR